MLKCVNLILENRKKVHVPSENPILAKVHVPSENPSLFDVLRRLKKEFKYLRACNLMRKFSVECGAEHPEKFCGTQLRKHIATTCITLNLEEQEVSDLANFMGHAEKIHKNIYRQPLLNRDFLICLNCWKPLKEMMILMTPTMKKVQKKILLN